MRGVPGAEEPPPLDDREGTAEETACCTMEYTPSLALLPVAELIAVLALWFVSTLKRKRFLYPGLNERRIEAHGPLAGKFELAATATVAPTRPRLKEAEIFGDML